MKNCYFHHDKEATHTDSIVDLNPPDRGVSYHEISYKRVPICYGCAIERMRVNTSRVEELEVFGAAGGNQQEPQK